ncbi:hypothetical protein HGRIS_010825 [Hohenbuehelia grisea]|uniref:MYND-type domain-containing protein n=1 Tax=Hohenbuehelia grisea TaxID=104357 RepID=A0ABR3IYE0_9AGAR
MSGPGSVSGIARSFVTYQLDGDGKRAMFYEISGNLQTSLVFFTSTFTMSADRRGFCSVCKAGSDWVCSRCAVPYCSRACQTKTYGLHRLVCRNLRKAPSKPTPFTPSVAPHTRLTAVPQAPLVPQSSTSPAMPTGRQSILESGTYRHIPHDLATPASPPTTTYAYEHTAATHLAPVAKSPVLHPAAPAAATHVDTVANPDSWFYLPLAPTMAAEQMALIPGLDQHPFPPTASATSPTYFEPAVAQTPVMPAAAVSTGSSLTYARIDRSPMQERLYQERKQRREQNRVRYSFVPLSPTRREAGPSTPLSSPRVPRTPPNTPNDPYASNGSSTPGVPPYRLEMVRAISFSVAYPDALVTPIQPPIDDAIPPVWYFEHLFHLNDDIHRKVILESEGRPLRHPLIMFFNEQKSGTLTKNLAVTKATGGVVPWWNGNVIVFRMDSSSPTGFAEPDLNYDGAIVAAELSRLYHVVNPASSRVCY